MSEWSKRGRNHEDHRRHGNPRRFRLAQKLSLRQGGDGRRHHRAGARPIPRSTGNAPSPSKSRNWPATWSAARPSHHHFTQMVYNDFAGRRASMELASPRAPSNGLWDIVGRALDQPVYNLLGGRVATASGSTPRLYTFLETAREYADEAQRMVALGFDAIKFDPFPNPWRTFIPRRHEDHAVAVVEAVRQAVGPDIDLLLEFSAAWPPCTPSGWPKGWRISSPTVGRTVPDRQPGRHCRGERRTASPSSPARPSIPRPGSGRCWRSGRPTSSIPMCAASGASWS